MKKTKILLVGALLLGVPSVALSLSTQQENATVVRAAEKTMKFGTNADVTINGANITKTYDNKKWSFVTKGTTSFTNNEKNAFSQIGSSSKPATSFTITSDNYGSNLVLTNFYIKFGGYSGTKGTIKCSYEGNDIGSLSLNGTNDVELNKDNLKILSTGASLGFEISVTNISKGFKLYSLSYSFMENNPDAKEYTITYDANDGICEKEKDTYLEGRAGITLPDAKREGYTFDGWYDEDNNKVTSPYIPEKDTTLHAKWILNVNVTFKMNDGTDDNFVISTIKQGSKVEIPSTEPSRNGYSFTNWYTSADLSEEYNFDLIVNENLTLYAGWKEYEASTFTKVTSSLTDWTGKYLIVYEDGADAYVFNGIDGYINGKIENDKIQSTSEIEKNICTISKFNNGYSINIKNKYLSGTNNKNSLNLSQTEQLNNISFENNSIKIESNTSILRFNDTQDIMQFKYYKSSTYTYQEAIQLYKLEEKQEEQPTIDETTLTSYKSILSIDNSKAIRFIGSVKETEFNNISKIGFNFTLKMKNDNPISKEYSSDVNKLYKTINDSNVGIFDNNDAIYENNGFLNFSLILKNIPTNIAATIEFYSYAVINGKTYHSLTKDVVIMNGEIA